MDGFRILSKLPSKNEKENVEFRTPIQFTVKSVPTPIYTKITQYRYSKCREKNDTKPRVELQSTKNRLFYIFRAAYSIEFADVTAFYIMSCRTRKFLQFFFSSSSTFYMFKNAMRPGLTLYKKFNSFERKDLVCPYVDSFVLEPKANSNKNPTKA